MAGCSAPRELKRSVEQRPVVEKVELYADEPYIVQESRVVGQNCVERHYSEINNSRFNVSFGEKEWLMQPPVDGQTNYLRRVVTVFNALNEIDTIYLDKVYLYNGTETKRSRHPMKFLVDPRSTRTLYVMWDTQYDPLKDVVVDFTNNTEETGFETRIMRLCVNETSTVNITKYKKVVTGTEEKVIGYDNYVKVKLDRKS
ncbi:hypothetical protein KY349_00895 [Candidatus Woesearchaeota archaeon]|nr:hypothetical protein [Candidatus Woesearchaeota archaeon]